MGIQVSFLFKSERSKRPVAEKTRESRMTTRTVPQIRRPPIVGVPLFFAWSALNRGEASPVMAFSRICLPILNWINLRVNQGLKTKAIRNAKVPDPKIKIRFEIIASIFTSYKL